MLYHWAIFPQVWHLSVSFATSLCILEATSWYTLDILWNLEDWSYNISWDTFTIFINGIVTIYKMERSGTLETESDSATCPTLMPFVCSFSFLICSIGVYCPLCVRTGLCHKQWERLGLSLETKRHGAVRKQEENVLEAVLGEMKVLSRQRPSEMWVRKCIWSLKINKRQIVNQEKRGWTEDNKREGSTQWEARHREGR